MKTTECVSVSLVHDIDTGETFRHSVRVIGQEVRMLNKEDESLPPPTLLQRIEQNDSSLKELAGFGGFSCHKIAASLRRNHTIKSFKLSHCNLGDDNDDGCKHIMQALIDRRSSLKRISLARNNIGFEGALAIANFILASRQKDSTILYDSIRLDLLQNCFGDEGARVIADAIANNRTNGVDNIQTIINIGFEKNRIGDVGLSYISNMLCGNTKLHTLRLGKNMITHEGVVKYLAPALAMNTSLRTLDLSSNRNIGDVGAAALAEILTSNNQTLETLILTKCSITETGAVRLLKALYNDKSPYSVLEESNHTLREIMLCQNPVMSASLSGLSTTFLRDALQWNQNGIASARIFKLHCFLTSNDGPRYVHSIDLIRELIPNFVFKIWRISCLGVLYAYLREMPELLEGCK